MFNKKSSKKRKKTSPILYIFVGCFVFIIPFIYKLFFSNYIKNYFQNSLEIKISKEIISKIRNIYTLLFNQYYLQILIPLLLVYNYCNIYKTFILLIYLQFPIIISQLLNLFMINTIIEKETNDELLYSMGYSLFLWNLIFKSENNNEKNNNSSRSIDTIQKKKNSKYIYSLIIMIISIILQYLINFILFNDIDKLIFDAILGATLYCIFFHIFKLKTNNPRQFKKIIEFRLKYYFLLFLFFNLLFIIFCINIINNNETKINIIKNIIYKYSLTSIVIGIILGVKYEYNYYFEQKLNIWTQYNFESDYEISFEEEEESLTSIISSNDKKQWNNTSFLISLFRLIFILAITFGCLYSFLFLKFEIFIVDLFLKYIFPLNLFSLGLFYWYKLLLKYLKVTNIFLLTSFRESF